MTASEHETSTHEVAGKTPFRTADKPPVDTHEDTTDLPGADRAPAYDPVVIQGKLSQIKPDGR